MGLLLYAKHAAFMLVGRSNPKMLFDLCSCSWLTCMTVKSKLGAITVTEVY